MDFSEVIRYMQLTARGRAISRNTRRTIAGRLHFPGSAQQNCQHQGNCQGSCVQEPQKSGRHQTTEAFGKEPEEIPVSQQKISQDSGRGEGEISGSVISQLRAGDPENHLGAQIVGHQREHQKAHIEKALFQKLPGVFARQHTPDQYQHQQACRHGNIGLINAERQHQCTEGWEDIPLFVLLHQVSRDNGQQEGKGKGTAGEHIAEQTRQRGEDHNTSGQNSLKQPVADAEHVHQNADTYRHQENSQKTVNPGHGIVGENGIQSPETPASGNNGGTLNKQGMGLIVIEELVGQHKAVSQKAEYHRRKKRSPKLPEK